MYPLVHAREPIIVSCDGKRDLVVANYLWPVPALLGTGTGSFVDPLSFNAGSGPRSVAVGDFNLDGAQDLAVPNQLSANVPVLNLLCFRLLRAGPGHAPVERAWARRGSV